MSSYGIYHPGFFTVYECLLKKMGLIVLPATISDIKEVYDVYFASFDGQLINQVLFPGGITEEFRKTHTEHTLQWWHTSTMQHTFKCVDTDTGKIVGMAIWDIYWREKTEAERQKPWIGWLEGKERERAEGFVVPFWEQRERWLGGRRHVCEYPPSPCGRPLLRHRIDGCI